MWWHSRHLKTQESIDAGKICVALLVTMWGALIVWLQHNALSVRPDGVWAGHLNIWSDWPMHIAMASAFADRSAAEWFSSHPMFAHGELHYPFAVNLLSGLMMRLGLGLDAAMSLPTLLAGAAIPLLLYRCFYAGLHRAGTSVLAVSLFFLASGPGGFSYLAELMQSGNWHELLYPIREVSRIDHYDWYSGNFLTGMLVPQRAFVLGLPIALLSLLALSRSLQPGKKHRVVYAIAGGAGAGILPIVHIHSYMALGLIGVAFAACHPKPWRMWMIYGVIAMAIGGTLSLIFLNGGLSQHLRWAPGFAAGDSAAGWLLMWWKLWGIALPLTLLSLPLLRSASPVTCALTLGGALCFLFANLILIQPSRWDNSKLFLWTYLCWAPLWASAVSYFWSSSQRYAGRVVAVALSLMLTLTGTMELTRLINRERSRHMIANVDDVRLGLQVRAETDPMAVFLTNTSHNHPIMTFGGRSIVLGFTGWMANLGFDYAQREADVRTMYAGGEAARVLLARYGVDFVVIGPAERQNFAANAAWYARHYPLRFSNRDYEVYDVRSAAPGHARTGAGHHAATRTPVMVTSHRSTDRSA